MPPTAREDTLPGRLIDQLLATDPVAGADPSSVRVVHAPGRVNLIGEHTDYNGGYVFPAAIDLGITIALVPTDDRRVSLTLAADGDQGAMELDAIGPRTGGWIDYIAGTAWALAEAGLPTRGFRGILASDLPAGAGLSSSAAIELAAAWALSGGESPPTDPMTLARTAQRAENAYVGVASGLMDQFAVTFGQADHALLLDCRSLDHRAVPLPPGTQLVVCHSGAPRTLATSEYNARRAECDRAVAGLAAIDPTVRSLRDVTPELLEAGRDRLDDTAFRRARHVVTEDARVLETVAALEGGDLESVGAALSASHRSLRDDFEVSSPALDALVEIADTVPGVIGARLTGAGFGGCTINLVHDAAVGPLREVVLATYPRPDRPDPTGVRGARRCRRPAPRVIALRVLVTAVGAALGVFYPFLSVILAEFGFTPGEIGLVFSLGAVGFTLAVPAWGHIADVKLGRARTLQICAVGAAAAVLGLLLPVPALVIVALMLLFWIFECSFQPLADALTVNAVRGRDYARTRLFTSLGFAVAAILSGFLYDQTGYWPSFVLFALAAAAIVVSAAFLPDVGRADLGAIRQRAELEAGRESGDMAIEPLDGAEPTPISPPPGRSWHLSLGSVGVAFRVAPRLFAVLLASILLHIGILSGFTFLPLRLEALGGSASDVALSAGLSALAEIPSMLVMGLFVRRLGLRGVFGVAALIYAACMASWMVIDVPLAIVGTRVITGLAFAGVVISVVLTIAAILPRDLQATGQALFQTSAFGIASIIANVIGGQLYESIGPAAVFGLGAVLAVAAAAIGWFAFPRSPT